MRESLRYALVCGGFALLLAFSVWLAVRGHEPHTAADRVPRQTFEAVLVAERTHEEPTVLHAIGKGEPIYDWQIKANFESLARRIEALEEER